MKSSVRIIISLMLLVVFLLPSTGMIIYIHHCNLSSSTVFVTDNPKSCCSGKLAILAEDEKSCGLTTAEQGIYTGTTIEALPCCDNSMVFLKLGLQLLSHSVKVMLSNFPVFITSNFSQIQIAVSLNHTAFSNYIIHPPGELPFILNSSLRL